MADYEIIRRERITVESSEYNQYGDLLVTTTAGNEYKIGNKRAQLFAVFHDGAEVVIGWATFKGREYIAEATPASQVVSANTPITPEKPKALPEESINPQERGMWYKEIGEMYRAGIIKKDTLEGKALMTAYWARMLIALDIEIKKA